MQTILKFLGILITLSIVPLFISTTHGQSLTVAVPMSRLNPSLRHESETTNNLTRSAPNDLRRDSLNTRPIAPLSNPNRNPTAIPYNYPRHEIQTIDSDILGICLALTTQETFSYFAFDRRVRREGSNTEPENLDAADFLEYLRGYMDRYQYTTSETQALESWILEQPENSIDPVALYRQSLLLNQGNIWTAVLTIHETLRRQARWWHSDRYFFRSNSHREHALFNRFIDIRGDLAERGSGFHGDHEGTWYRIWGVFLYQLMGIDRTALLRDSRRPRNGGSCPIDGQRDSLPLFPSASPVGDIATYAGLAWVELSKFNFLPGEGNDDDLRKIEINQRALATINVMLHALRSPSAYYGVTSQVCRDRRYLISTP